MLGQPPASLAESVSRNEALAQLGRACGAASGLLPTQPHGFWSLKRCSISSLLLCLQHPCSMAFLSCCAFTAPALQLSLLSVSCASDHSCCLVLCGFHSLPSLVRRLSALLHSTPAGATSVAAIKLAKRPPAHLHHNPGFSSPQRHQTLSPWQIY